MRKKRKMLLTAFPAMLCVAAAACAEGNAVKSDTGSGSDYLIPLIAIIVILGPLIAYAVISHFTDPDVLKCRSEKSALKALKHVSEWKYTKLCEIAKKSKFPEVRRAAAEKNRTGLAISRAWTSRLGSEFPVKECSRGTVAEPGSLAVCRINGVHTLPEITEHSTCLFIPEVTAALPGELAASSPTDAEYILLLRSYSKRVGNYTDGAVGYLGVLNEDLIHRTDGAVIRQKCHVGEMPAGEKIHRQDEYGSAADPVPVILSAARKVMKLNKK